MAQVEDKDLGMRAMVKAAMKADGLELRNGILDSRIRYPKTKGALGQQVAKVAGILGVHRAISEGYDSKRGEIDRGMKLVLLGIHKGKLDASTLIQALIGRKIQRAQRTAAMRVVKRRTGRMREAIRSTVFEGGRIGNRGSASSGTKAAGDDPKRPKASDKVGQ